MNVALCVKPVKAEYVSKDYGAGKGQLVLNPYDLYALKYMVQLKKQYDIHITCIAMGNNHAEEVLRHCIAQGADEIVLVSDSSFAGSDTYSTTYILSKALEKLGHIDLYVCGSIAVDGETGQVPYGLAARLHLPVILNINDILTIKEECMDIVLYRENIKEKYQVQLPALISFDNFTTKDAASSFKNLKRSKQISLSTWNLNQLELDSGLCGLQGSKTQVLKITESIKKKDSVELKGTCEECVSELLLNLKLKKE